MIGLEDFGIMLFSMSAMLILAAVCFVFLAIFNNDDELGGIGTLFLIFGVFFFIISMPLCVFGTEEVQPQTETIEMCLDYDSCDNCYNKFINTDQIKLFHKFIENGRCKPSFQEE